MAADKSEGEREAGAKAPHYHGHRDRLRERFLEGGGKAIQDYELLELILFRAIPRRDLKPLAKELLDTFGSFAEVIAAPPARLRQLKGLGSAAVADLQIVHEAVKRFMAVPTKKREVLSSWDRVLDYCRTAMAFEEKEQFRVLFLDKRNQLLADEVQQTGTVDHTPVYPREVVKRALELSATAVLLIHNHPSGDPTPSRVDVEMTKSIIVGQNFALQQTARRSAIAGESCPSNAAPTAKGIHFAGRRRLTKSVPTMIVPVNPPSRAAF